MKLERFFKAEKPVMVGEACMTESEKKGYNDVINGGILSRRSSVSEISNDFCNHSESFKKLVEMRLPVNETVEAKLAWLRSQIVGDDAEFDSPFGRRRLLYADHTASGRCLYYNENFIIDHLLPFYGM